MHPLTFLVMSTEGHIILGKVEGERWETNIKRAIFYINKVQKRAIFWAKARYFEGEFSHAPAFFPSMPMTSNFKKIQLILITTNMAVDT